MYRMDLVLNLFKLRLNFFLIKLNSPQHSEIVVHLKSCLLLKFAVVKLIVQNVLLLSMVPFYRLKWLCWQNPELFCFVNKFNLSLPNANRVSASCKFNKCTRTSRIKFCYQRWRAIYCLLCLVSPSSSQEVEITSRTRHKLEFLENSRR